MTDKDAEGCPYCQCSSLVFVPIDANYGERRCASCGAVHSVMQIEDHAELARLRAELEQARVQLAGCLCAAEGTGDADKVKQGDYAWTPALQKMVELRAALAEAEREREEARGDAAAWKKRYFDAGRSEDAFAADMARLMVGVFKKDEELLKERDAAKDLSERQRRTIRALVVAARAIKKLLWLRLARDIVKFDNTDDPDELVKQMREMVEAERGLAGKEQP